MLALRTGRIPEHKLLHQIRAHTTRIPGHILRYCQRAGQHMLRPVTQLREQAVPDLVFRDIRAPRCGRGERPAVPDEPREEEGATSFHDEAAAGEDEADFRAAVRD